MIYILLHAFNSSLLLSKQGDRLINKYSTTKVPKNIVIVEMYGSIRQGGIGL